MRGNHFDKLNSGMGHDIQPIGKNNIAPFMQRAYKNERIQDGRLYWYKSRYTPQTPIRTNRSPRKLIFKSFQPYVCLSISAEHGFNVSSIFVRPFIFFPSFALCLVRCQRREVKSRNPPLCARVNNRINYGAEKTIRKGRLA